MTSETNELEITNPTPPKSRLEKVTCFANWRRQAQQLKNDALFYYFVFKHRNMPWYARLVAICTAGYVLSPVQLIPNFIPVIGFLDDILVLLCGAKLLQKITPPEILSECRELVKIAAQDRVPKTLTFAAAVTRFAISGVWLLVGVAASVMMAYHFSH